MYYPEKMSFVSIAGPSDTMRDVIDTIHNAKVLHIDDHKQTEDGLPIGKPFPEGEKVASLLLDLSFIKSVLTLPGTEQRINLNEAEAIIDEAKKEVEVLIDAQKQQQQYEKEQEQYQKERDFLTATGIDNPALLETQTCTSLCGVTVSPQKIEQAVSDLSCEVFYQNRQDKSYPIILVAKKEQIDEIKKRIASHFSPVTLHFREAEQKKQSEKIPDKKALEEKFGKQLRAAEHLLKEKSKKAEVPLLFAQGERSYVISGWVPNKRVSELKEKVTALSDSIHIDIEKSVGNGPTVLANPKGVKSFEFFLNLYSLPKLREIDPTFLVFLSFPIFFGVMLGDIGYGLILYIVFSVLRWRAPRFKGLFDIVILSSIFTVIFGAFFGEFFGFEEVAGIKLPSLLHRLHDVNELLALAIGFGLVHLNLGFIFGFVNEWKMHSFMTAVFTKASWILFEFAGILLVLDFMFGIPIFPSTILFALIGLSMLMLLKGEGFIGIVEIPNLIGSILSYLRLGAVGMASALIAFVVNRMAGDLFAAGGVMMAVGVLLLIIGHAGNIMLGLMDAFLQSLRLHYVEQFSRFYGGNGKPYNPFGR